MPTENTVIACSTSPSAVSATAAAVSPFAHAVRALSQAIWPGTMARNHSLLRTTTGCSPCGDSFAKTSYYPRQRSDVMELWDALFN
jgi:hypothetical protein